MHCMQRTPYKLPRCSVSNIEGWVRWGRTLHSRCYQWSQPPVYCRPSSGAEQIGGQRAHEVRSYLTADWTGIQSGAVHSAEIWGQQGDQTTFGGITLPAALASAVTTREKHRMMVPCPPRILCWCSYDLIMSWSHTLYQPHFGTYNAIDKGRIL